MTEIMTATDALLRSAGTWRQWSRENSQSPALFQEIQSHRRAPNNPNLFVGRRFYNATTFQGCAFGANSPFPQFRECVFLSPVQFDNCSFSNVSLSRLKFSAGVVFVDCKFDDNCRFDRIKANKFITFHRCTFKGQATFIQLQTLQSIEFDSTNIATDLSIFSSKIKTTMLLSSCNVGRHVNIRDAYNSERMQFIECEIGGNLSIWPSSKRTNTTPEASPDITLLVTETTIEKRFLIKPPLRFARFALTNCRVESATILANIHFTGECDLSSTAFNGSLNLAGSAFFRTPDFRRTAMKHHLSMRDMKIGNGKPEQLTWFPKNILQPYASPEAEDKIRRLKEMAKRAEDTEQELHFLAEELKAKRYFTDKGVSLFFNLLYQATSDFGRSITRPLIALATLWLLFAQAYAWLGAKSSNTEISVKALSLVQMIPFLSASRLTDFKWYKLFANPWSDYAAALGFLQGILSGIFLFLLLLALRNRFRL